MKNKIINKIAIIAFVVAFVLSSGLLIQQLGLPIRAYADALISGEQVTGSETFLDIRSEAKYDDNATYNEMVTQFEDISFQRDENNFEHIVANALAGITDRRYGITLGEEAKAITLTRDNNGKVSGPKITDNSTLTVFTYGQGGTLSHWSNAGTPEYEAGYNIFKYDENSMIEMLRRESGADVYIAKTQAITVDNGTTYKFNVAKNDTEELLLYKLDASHESYYNVEKQLSKDTLNRVSQIEDMTKHNIIIFDSNQSSQYHNFVYNELNIILTQISYDYLLTIGQVPKISMISHSTGGVWNMMWANKHPLNVDKLFAIAAPFNGTALGHYLYFNWDKMRDGVLGKAISEFRSSVTNPSGMNNVDSERYNALHADWEDAVEINPDLYCFAFTGLTSEDLGVAMAHGNVPEWADSLLSGLNSMNVTMQLIIAYIVINIITELATRLINLIASGILVLAGFFMGPVGVIIVTVAFTVVIEKVMEYFTDIIADFLYRYGELANYIINSLVVDENGSLCIKDDCIVDYNSALGYAADDLGLGHKEYSNFERFEKTFRSDNCDISRKNMNQIAVPHNLEVQDADIIADVCGNIVMKAPDTRYVYETLPDDTISVTSIKSGYYNEKIIIPDCLYGKPVVQVGNNESENKSEQSALIDTTNIQFGSNVTVITALEGAKNLRTVDFPEGLLEIGDSAFAGTSLSEVDIPSSVMFIGSCAFQDTKLTSVVIPNSLISIGSSAFENCNNLNEVKFKDDSENNLKIVGKAAFNGTKFIKDDDNTILGNVLIKYIRPFNDDNSIGEDIKYFAYDCFKDQEIEGLNLQNYKFVDNTVPDYFLYGAKLKTPLKIPEGVQIISNSAFESLIIGELTLPASVEVIGSMAFSNSNVEAIYIESPYPPVISADAFTNAGIETLFVKSFAFESFKTSWSEAVNNTLGEYVFQIHTANLSLYGLDTDLDGANDIITFKDIGYYSYLELGKYVVPTKSGYYFNGWYDAFGNRYYQGSLLEFKMDEEWALYAHWELINYNVWYEDYGGIYSNPDTITILDDIKLAACQKTGYIFKGWYENAEFDGEPIETLTLVDHDIMLYACFEAIKTNVFYDNTGITLNVTVGTISYGENYVAPIPEKVGYAFSGWYTTLDDSIEKGIRITGTNGRSIKRSAFLNDITLYARWTPKSFILEFDDGNNTYVFGNDGLTKDAGSIMAGTIIDLDDPEILAFFRREGYHFCGFTTTDGKPVNFTEGVPDIGDNFSAYQIMVNYTAETYTFYVYDEDGSVKKFTLNYDSDYYFNLTKLGYELVGLTDKDGNVIFDEARGYLATDFTPGVEDSSFEMELYVLWEKISGNISFDSAGGTRVDSQGYIATYGEILPSVNIPTREGYKFKGFYDENGKMYIDEYGQGIVWDKTERFIILEAQWEVEYYLLTYMYMDYYETSYVDSFSVEEPINISIKPEKVGFSFLGWYDAITGGNIVYNTSTFFENTTIYARWTENSYAITGSYKIEISIDNRSIDLSKITTAVNYHIISLSSEVQNLLIKGTATKPIVIQSNSDTLNLYLNNVKLVGVTGYSTVFANNLLVFAIGESSITGANGTTGSSGSNGNGSVDHGTPSNGSPKAGNGNAGSNGANGSNGYFAIEANNSILIEGSANAKLTLTGGNGGNGGNGGIGGNGAYGNDGRQGGGKDNGVAGGNGGIGGNGGNGGNGAVAAMCKSFKTTLLNLSLVGGAGGNGGDGGKGGDGGRGGKGADNNGWLIFATNYAGKGGNGGDAGNGGNGGNSGYGASGISANIIIGTLGSNKNGQKGSGGNGGAAGDRGMYGNGGKGPIGGSNGSYGSIGSTGQAGI